MFIKIRKRTVFSTAVCVLIYDKICSVNVWNPPPCNPPASTKKNQNMTGLRITFFSTKTTN